MTTATVETGTQHVTAELRQWIVDQARAGCQPEDVLTAMETSGWTRDVAEQAVETTLREELQRVNAQKAEVLPPAVPVPEPDLSGAAARIRAGGRDIEIVMTMQQPRVVVLGNFLGEDECEQMIAAARPRMERSQTVVYETGGNEVNAARTSQGMFFSRGESPLVQAIEERIAEVFRWPLVNGEGLQVLHYQPGAEYKPHHDYFDPAQPGMASVLARGGQRVGTLVMYLNTPTRGGGTTFPDVGLEVAPIRGNAVFFSYERAHASTRTLHGGAPVLDGDKWVATKWLREREFV